MTIAGSNVSANDVVLAAKNRVNVIHTTNTDSTRSSNSSSSASIGVQYTLAGGWGVSGAMSNAHGDANSDASIQNASHVTGANSITVISGGDTNIIGSQVNGKQVTADVGGNLNIASVQDVTNSAAHQSSTGGGFTVSQGGGSASFSAQNGHADSNYAGVNEQAGINAGDGGFNVNVKGNTGLTGGVISSTADTSKNSLTTGTLTFSDIQNQSHYSANSNGISAGVGFGGSTGKSVGPGSVSGTPGVSPMISQNENGDESATTRSAISAGTITVTDGAHQTQDIAGLSRDTSNTNGTVAKTPDVNNILNQQADTMQAAQAAGQAVPQGIGQYADYKRDTATDKATADAWDEGGSNRTLLHIAGGALIGGLGGGGAFSAIGGAAGAGLASKMADELDDISKGVASTTGSPLIGNLAGNIAAGLGGVVVGGTAGAATGSTVELYNQQLDVTRKKRSLVPSACSALGQCNETAAMAQVNAAGANAQVASENMKTEAMYGVPAAAVVALGPEAMAAAGAGFLTDFGGATYSYLTGQSKDAPNFTNSYIAGVVAGLSAPLSIGDAAISQMGTIGKIAANGYNAAVSGIGAFGSAGMTGGNPDGAAAGATLASAFGSGTKTVLPGSMGNFLNQMIQGAAGPVQTAIQNGKSKQ
jgi:filamentous hemagglutinin